MNRKGFTLVELIAMMVVLSVLIVITVPNMTGILTKNKDNITIEDINKMVSATKTKIKTKEAAYPKENNNCVIMTLGFIDSNDDFKKGINEGTYSKTKSFVVIRKTKDETGSNVYKYKYYIRLVEENDTKQYGLGLVDYDKFVAEPSKYMSEARKPSEKSADKDISTITSNSGAKTLVNNDDGQFKKIELSCSEVEHVYK